MLIADIRYALRAIRLRPAAALATVLTLALAIAANGSLFTLVNAALLAPLPVRDPGSLVNVYTTRADGSGSGALSYPDYQDLIGTTSVFEGALGYSGLMVTASAGGLEDQRSQVSEVLFGELVTANYFSLLGVQPALGRGFLDEEGRERGAHPVAVIGHRLWRRRFGGDPGAVGRMLVLNGRPFRIVGVAPDGFSGLLFRGLSADVWVPASMMGHVRADALDDREERWMFVKARLKPAVTPAQAAAASVAVAGRLARDYPASNSGRTFRVIPASDILVHPEADRAVIPVALGAMVACGLVLAIACANLAGVTLAKGLARRREMAVRIAIGATRTRIVRQLLTESAVLSAAGGAGGLLLSWWCARLLTAWHPELPVPISLNSAVDWRVALYTLALTAGATVAFALWPAFRTADPGRALEPLRRRRFWLGARDALLVPQLALATTLVVTAGLLSRSLSRADAVDAGFDLRHTAFVSLNLAMSRYDDDRARRFYDELAAGLERRGAIARAAVTDRLPLDLYGNQSMEIAFGDRFELTRTVQVAHVGAAYHEVVGAAVLRGRSFTAADERAGAATAIVSAAAARLLWPGEEVVGRTIRVAASRAPVEVVGVAADVKVRTLGEKPEPLVYLPMQQGHARLLRLVVRTARDPREIAGELRREAQRIDPDVAVFEARSVADNVAVMLYPYRLAATAGSVLAALALALSAVGLYGVLASGVAERLRDLAIRIAIGASRGRIARAACADVLRGTVVGLAIGGLLSAASATLLRGVLFGIPPWDPATAIGTCATLSTVILAASAVPLRRAARISPMTILRQ